MLGVQTDFLNNLLKLRIHISKKRKEIFIQQLWKVCWEVLNLITMFFLKNTFNNHISNGPKRHTT